MRKCFKITFINKPLVASNLIEHKKQEVQTFNKNMELYLKVAFQKKIKNRFSCGI